MGTFYTLSSEFVARAGMTEDQLRNHITERSGDGEIYHELPDMLKRGEMSFSISRRRLTVSLEFSNHCAYSTATGLDDEWTRLAKDFADFSRGPVRCRSDGEDYDEGAHYWLIGHERAVLRTRLRDVRSRIAELQREQRDLAKALKGATRRLVSSTC